MIATYEFCLMCKCPANDSKDAYEVKLTTHRMIRVEDLIVVAEEYNDGRKEWQESITTQLAERLAPCKVVLIGYHHGIRTTSESSTL